jgi:hypothetical protein
MSRRIRKSVQRFEAGPASSKHRGDRWNDACYCGAEKHIDADKCMNIYDGFLHKPMSVIWKTGKRRREPFQGYVADIRRNKVGKIEHFIVYNDGDEAWHDLSEEECYFVDNPVQAQVKPSVESPVKLTVEPATRYRPPPVFVPENQNEDDEDSVTQRFRVRLERLGVPKLRCDSLAAFANANSVSASQLRHIVANLQTNPNLLDRLNTSPTEEVFKWNVHDMKRPDQLTTYDSGQREYKRWHTLDEEPLQCNFSTELEYESSANDSSTHHTPSDTDEDDPPKHSDYSDTEDECVQTMQVSLVEALKQVLDNDNDTAKRIINDATTVETYLQHVHSAGGNVDACRYALEQKKQEMLSGKTSSSFGLNLQWETRHETKPYEIATRRTRLLRWW